MQDIKNSFTIFIKRIPTTKRIVMTEKLINYFEKQQQLFTEYYNESRKYYTINSVHEMRLCMKRLRALFIFFEALEPDVISTKIMLSNFRKLFKQAGKIRDIQIQKKLALHLEQELNASFAEYIQFLNKSEKKAIRSFEKKMHGYEPKDDFDVLRTIIADTLSNYGTENISERGRDILYDKFSLVHKMTLEKLNTEQLHAIRTKLKQIAYLLKIWKDYEVVTQVIPADRSYLQGIEIKLGLWHDYVVAQTYITKFIAAHQEENPVPDQYATILKAVLKHKRSLAIVIKPQLKSLFENNNIGTMHVPDVEK